MQTGEGVTRDVKGEPVPRHFLHRLCVPPWSKSRTVLCKALPKCCMTAPKWIQWHFLQNSTWHGFSSSFLPPSAEFPVWLQSKVRPPKVGHTLQPALPLSLTGSCSSLQPFASRSELSPLVGDRVSFGGTLPPTHMCWFILLYA